MWKEIHDHPAVGRYATLILIRDEHHFQHVDDEFDLDRQIKHHQGSTGIVQRVEKYDAEGYRIDVVFDDGFELRNWPVKDFAVNMTSTKNKVQISYDENGTKYWFRDGMIHRDGGPAIVWLNGTKEWFKDNKRHREDGPAIEWASGKKEWWLNGRQMLKEVWERRIRSNESATHTKMPHLIVDLLETVPKIQIKYREDGAKEYYKNGQLHRDDGPAVEWEDGSKLWYKNGQCHRVGGPAVEWADGTKAWYKNDQPHRGDGPAVEYADGTKEWWKNGKRHRDDGPAYEGSDGSKEWWLNGKQMSKEEWERRIDVRISPRKKRSDESVARAKMSRLIVDLLETVPKYQIKYQEDGTKEYYKNGLLHREAQPGQSPGPAIEWANGSKSWYKNGQLHRDDGPAIESIDGTKEWWLNGQYLRNDDPVVKYTSKT